MAQDQVLQEIEDMMRIVKKEKENLEKVLANLEADNEGKPVVDNRADLPGNQ